ncbi:DNA helicase Pif1 like protein, partial [Cubamyces menziesii]
SKLNAEQYQIYTEIMDAVTHRRPLCAFVDGKAGRGKTFLVNTICNKLRSAGHVVLPTATSAFAAQLYPGGKTTHSVFKVRVCALQNEGRTTHIHPGASRRRE